MTAKQGLTIQFALANSKRSSKNKIKITASPQLTVQKYIDALKMSLPDNQKEIRLFYSGRFLNPNFKIKDIHYTEGYPIYIYQTNSIPDFQTDEFTKTININDLVTTKTFMKSQHFQENNPDPDIEDEFIFNQSRSMKNSTISRKLCDQAQLNHVDDNVMIELYHKLNDNLELTLNFFNEEAKYYTNP